MYLSFFFNSLKSPSILSSNIPLKCVPLTRAIGLSITISLSSRTSGTSPLTIKLAIPYTIAVLPQPPSPTNTALFFFLLERTLIISLISCFLPTISSIFPFAASLLRLVVYCSTNSFDELVDMILVLT